MLEYIVGWIFIGICTTVWLAIIAANFVKNDPSVRPEPEEKTTGKCVVCECEDAPVLLKGEFICIKCLARFDEFAGRIGEQNASKNEARCHIGRAYGGNK